MAVNEFQFPLKLNANVERHILITLRIQAKTTIVTTACVGATSANLCFFSIREINARNAKLIDVHKVE